MFVSRRRALLGTGITLAASTVAGCATYGKPSPPSSPNPPSTPNQADTAAPAEAIASTADVPVGSGVIVGDVVLTQPAPGQFNCFSSVCTHAGCTVSEVTGALIRCPCHGSSFNLDGTVAAGPAERALDTKPIAVVGESITRG